MPQRSFHVAAQTIGGVAKQFVAVRSHGESALRDILHGVLVCTDIMASLAQDYTDIPIAEQLAEVLRIIRAIYVTDAQKADSLSTPLALTIEAFLLDYVVPELYPILLQGKIRDALGRLPDDNVAVPL